MEVFKRKGGYTMKSKEEKKNIYIECRNDRVDGLKGKVKVKNGERKVVFQYDGKYGQGYDGCGTHTHG